MKKIIILLLVLSTSVWISGCSLFGGNSQTTTKQSQPTLTIWRVGEDEDTFKNVISDFEEKNKVKINFVNKSYEDYELDALNSLAAHKGPDIMIVRNDWMLKHYDKLVPMPEGLLKKDKDDKSTNSDRIKEIYPDIVTKDVVIKDKVYGMPLAIDNMMLFINPKLVNAGIVSYNDSLNKDQRSLRIEDYPKTWDEVQRLIPFLTKKEGGQVTQSAIALGTANNVTRSQDILYTLMLQNEAQMVSPDGLTAMFNLTAQKEGVGTTNPGLEALKFYRSFSDPASPNYTWNSSMPESIEAFIQGKVAMVLGYGYLNEYFEQKSPDLKYQTKKLPQVSKLANPVTLGNYWIEGVTKSAKNQTLAWSFLKTYASSLSRSSSYANKKELPRPYRSSLKIEDENPYMSQPLYATSFVKGVKPEKFDQEIYTMINTTVNGENPQKALDLAATNITKILRGEN